MLIYTDVEPTPEDVEFWRDSETYNNYENYCCQTKERIKQDPKFAFKYAEKLGGLPQEWEKVFLKSPEYAFYYSYFVRHKKLNPNIEIVFAQSAEWAYKYARNVRGKLPKKIEKAFLKCPEYALKYAQLTGRLEEKIEAVFLKNCEFAYLYAKEIIKGKFSKKIHNALFLKLSFEKNYEADRIYLEQYFNDFSER